ncbi:hypothetical protein FHR81_003814 [Actinoalloteichus hoggarensis]|uniref:Uncharacterized protein n=1 Tax=Actinoalloteichus hoggarensis TaxID=1470176 RepID=A0A221WBZ6_9PSEU|nr:hypothetical protein [Actinoalloteichus hoggarensis]ASO23153.1 hypothetical protein AHOG_27780 [Actinoalloteichus hoggarensis]MBB5922757.1 hypothetical protein [Actinoalloteichus hoggarensis]
MDSHPTPRRQASRRAVLGAALGVGATLLGGAAATAEARSASFGPWRPPGSGRRRVLLATNEPWGTYHVRPLLTEARRRGWELIQLVPDLSNIAPEDPVQVVTPGNAPPADLLVLNGAEDWPADCARRLRRLPVAAASLAYLPAEEATRAGEFRGRVRWASAGSPAEARAFREYLGYRPRVWPVGSPQTDDLPARRPEPNTVLILTSVTHPDETGGAAPGAELLLASAARLAESGRRVVVGLHPREDPALWDDYEISSLASVEASARVEAAVGIPGSVFPLVAAVGTPIVGCVDPALAVPEHLLRVCSSTVDDAADVVAAVEQAEPVDARTRRDVVGPVGGSARRLFDGWERITRRPWR